MSPEFLFIKIIVAISLIPAITIHEFAHAWVADHFGDPTPRSHGRVSLNPFRHLDPLGTLMLFIANFGWGKPVPIDPYNLSKREEILVAISGVTTNLIMAIICSIIIRLIPTSEIITGFLSIFIQINVSLAVFNLLPIPPLDGSKLFLNLLPEKQALEWESVFDQYGLILLAILIFLPIGNSNFIHLIISPIISFILRLLLGIS